MKAFTYAVALSLGFAACGGGGGDAEDETVVLSITASSVGQEYSLLEAAARRFEAANPGVKIEMLEIPDLATDRLALYLQYLGARSDDVDIYQIDVIWPGILAEHAVDLSQYVPQAEVGRHFGAIVANNTVGEKLVGLPWFTDAGLLYYRTDLLAKYDFDGPPETWDELERCARVIQDGERSAGRSDFWGFLWQGKAYEGLTCNALEWQASSGGGTIVSASGVIEVDNPETVSAMKRATGWIGSISPPGITTYAEEDTRAIWQTGNAAFMRNWPYAYLLGNDPDPETGEKPVIAGRYDVCPLPSGGAGHVATLGGWQLMISRYSKHPAEAAAFVRFLASPAEQKVRAVEGSLTPTIQSLYEDREVLAAVPFFASLYDVLTQATARPSSISAARYNRVTESYFTAVHDILTGAPAADRLAQLETDLQRILR